MATYSTSRRLIKHYIGKHDGSMMYGGIGPIEDGDVNRLKVYSWFANSEYRLPIQFMLIYANKRRRIRRRKSRL